MSTQQTQTLPLSDIVDVVVQISPQSPPTPQFNQGIVIGNSTVIPSVTGTFPLRARQYTTLSAMVADGFTTTSPEYLAASLYFGQTPSPQFIWIGRWDLTAIATFTEGSGGTDYVAGDIITVVQSGASLGQLLVSAIGGSGAITTLSLIQGSQGTGYSVASGLATTGGSGTGATVNITAIGETPLQAIQACRLATPAWWASTVVGSVGTPITDAENEAIVGWAQAQIPQLCYFFGTQSANVLTGVGDIFTTLKAADYSRGFGIYSTVQGGAAPNNLYVAAAAMGLAMGRNTGLANSFFTMMFKPLVGITAEPITDTQKNLIESNNGNVYVNYANAYTWLEKGTVCDGQFLDEVLNLDMVSSDITYAVVDLLTSVNSLPQTDAGQTQLINTISQAIANGAALRGFIAGGIWAGETVLTLQPGTSVPNGYLCLSQPYSQQSYANRVARQSMPVYIALIEAGAVQSVLIGVYVQQ